MKYLQYYTDLQDYMDNLNGKRLINPNISLIRPEGGEDIIFKDFTTFYLFHSSDCTIEKVAASSKFGETGVNLTGFVKSGYFYGGVATDYGGKGTIATAIENNDYSAFANVDSVIDSSGEAYDGSSLKTTQNARFWTKTHFFKEKLRPENGHLYYLKEVPRDSFLQCYMGYTFDTNTNRVTYAGLVTNVDDTLYNSIAGEYIDTANSVNEQSVCRLMASYSIILQGSSTAVLTIKASDINGTRGYLGIPTFSNIVVPTGNSGADFTVGYTITTPDGVNVHRSRRIWTEDWNVNNLHGAYIDDISYS